MACSSAGLCLLDRPKTWHLCSSAMQSDKNWQFCQLDKNSSLSSETITSSFGNPITEEHAFAIIYESMKTLSNVISLQNKEGRKELLIRMVSTPFDLFLHKDGRVHEVTFKQQKSEINVEKQGKKRLNFFF